jgi:predicted phage baseplate assembly protein
MAPPDGSLLTAGYRVGVGAPGNVGAEALVHIVAPQVLPVDWPDFAPVSADAPRPVRNPLPAWGGVDPETLEEVKRLAPAAFRAETFRAVTEADYAAAAQKHPEVSRAVATFRWTGSWHTVFLTVDPVGRTDLPPETEESVLAWVTRYLQTGYDLEIDAPTYVPLDIEMDVCVEPDHFRSDVHEAVLMALSNQVLPDGSRAFFHPDNFTFGQALYLSQLYAAVEAVTGVESAVIRIFQRYGKIANNELQNGSVPAGRLEILRLDNDPNFAENGVLVINTGGGK